MSVIDQVVIALPREARFHLALTLKVVQVLQEEEPGCLLGVVELGRAARFLPQDIVEIGKYLLKHVSRRPAALGASNGNRSMGTRAR